MKIKPTKPIILSLCDVSGIMVHPWMKDHYCVTVDTNNGYTRETDYGLAINADITKWVYPIDWDLPKVVFAFPPCTDVAVSGARHFKSKGLWALINSLITLQHCIELCELATNFALIENPVSTFSTYYRKPDHKFHPWHYAAYLDMHEQKEEAYTKETWLWIFGSFKMPIIKPRFDYSTKYIHHLSPNDKRSYQRSLTPKGFALAVYEANK